MGLNKVRWNSHERSVGETAGGAWWMTRWGRVGDRQEASKMNPGFWLDL